MEKGQNNMLFTPSGCLTEKGLSMFSRGLLPAEDIAFVKGHLRGCELCAAAAEGFMLAGPDAFAEDLSFLNSGIAGLSSPEELFQETALSDGDRVVESGYTVKSQAGITQITEGAKTDGTADSTLAEGKQNPVINRKSKTVFQRHQFRLAAALILLLAGFGSIMLYLQFKHSTVNNETAAVIEKSDTTTSLLPSGNPVTERIAIAGHKGQRERSSATEVDSGTVMIITHESKISPLGYADHRAVGLIDKSSFQEQEKDGIAPVLGMPVAETPEAPQVAGNRKLPQVTAQNETELLIVSSANNDTETITDEADEKASKATRIKSMPAEEETTEAEIFSVVEESPHYPGGDEMRIKFLQENIKYPTAAREASLSGTVYISFVVEVDGTITDVRVLRGIGGGCDEEAVRVIKLMPKWVPGKQRGKPVRVQFNLAVQFRLAG